MLAQNEFRFVKDLPRQVTFLPKNISIYERLAQNEFQFVKDLPEQVICLPKLFSIGETLAKAGVSTCPKVFFL